MKGCFLLVEEIVEDGVFDVTQSVESYFRGASWFCDDEGLNFEGVEIELFSEVVDVVAGVEEVAD